MVGERLYQIIKESGYTQETAGALIGARKSTINNWIKSGNVQKSTKFYQLCIKAGWNSDWILTGKGDKFVQNNTLNENTIPYGNEEVIKLKGQVELLKEQLAEKDQHIIELIDLLDDHGIKRGARSG